MDYAKEIRKLIIESSYKANACHIGSALSCVEVLIEIFKKKREQDYFIFSKASGVAAYYSLLALKGYFSKEKITYYLKNYPLVSKEVPGAIWSGGSLGHGLPFACGLALADRTKNVYVLISDAELQEGTTWETLLFKRQHKLHNLKIYCDYNGFQACGKIIDILTIAEIKNDSINFRYNLKGAGISFMENDNSWHYRNLTLEERDLALKELK